MHQQAQQQQHREFGRGVEGKKHVAKAFMAEGPAGLGPVGQHQARCVDADQPSTAQHVAQGVGHKGHRDRQDQQVLSVGHQQGNQAVGHQPHQQACGQPRK